METFAADNNFPFSALVLSSPRPVQGGAHFTQASLGPGRPVYVQLPRCTLKQGIVTTKRACYCDLMYDKAQAEELITWLLALEGAAQDQIYKRRETWFHNDLSRDDMESMLTPMSRLYRGGRNLLIRASLRTDKATGEPKCTAYDEREAAVGLDAVDSNTTVIPLVLIDGVKFSARSFEIDVRLVQLMILDPRPEPTAACLIKHAALAHTGSPTSVSPDPRHDPSPAPEPEPGHASAGRDPTSKDTDGALPADPAATPAAVGRTGEESTAEGSSAELASNDRMRSHALADEHMIDDAAMDSESEDDGSIASEADLSREGDEATEAPVQAGHTPSDDNGELEEVEVGVGSDDDTMELRKPDDVYKDIYRAARRKARQMRRAAVEALLEAQKIKSQYMLDDVDDSEEDDDAQVTA